MDKNKSNRLAKDINPFEKNLVPETHKHFQFKLIESDPEYRTHKNIIMNWIKGQKDKDGRNKMAKEFQTSFKQMFWEFYIYGVLNNLEIEIGDETRPDYVLKTPEKVYIEAVTANFKAGSNHEIDRSFKDFIKLQCPPVSRANYLQEVYDSAIRCSSSISSKSKKYSEYASDPGFDEKAPYVIALGNYDSMHYGAHFIYPIILCLYGVEIDRSSGELSYRSEIQKPGTNSKIDTGLFSREGYRNVSAIFFSHTVTLGKLDSLSINDAEENYPKSCICVIKQDGELRVVTAGKENKEHLLDGIHIFHNPNANNPLDTSLFSHPSIKQYTYQDGQLIDLLPSSKTLIARMSVKKGSESELKPLKDNIAANYKHSSNNAFEKLHGKIRAMDIKSLRPIYSDFMINSIEDSCRFRLLKHLEICGIDPIEIALLQGISIQDIPYIVQQNEAIDCLVYSFLYAEGWGEICTTIIDSQPWRKTGKGLLAIFGGDHNVMPNIIELMKEISGICSGAKLELRNLRKSIGSGQATTANLFLLHYEDLIKTCEHELGAMSELSYIIHGCYDSDYTGN